MEKLGGFTGGISANHELAVGDVMKFATHTGKKGIAVVKSVSGNGTVAGDLVLDIKVLE
ncbi:hypothetical protein MTP09_09945 [Chryseobacterium suipulveris]|uniref:Uncharacterized protein n=1 Tax=Chryseobacterium suipulveris TaxID=2929800 RepID=A0ABY4BM19_9FLAO|nr:hypothetical protein [Chryseobacterium suipulveris]UOE40233.1 hypothetical protein MTP09_09945 [Chryseobacterium suipulveris]